MRIVIAADDIYAIHAGVLLASLREHAPEAETVLLHTGMSPENLAKLAVSEAVMIPGGQLAGLPARGHITRTAYLRLLAADVLPDDRVLYLDTDTVAASSLSPLLEAEYSDDFYLYAAEEAAADFKGQIGMDAKTPYFNSGVMVMNLEKWRRDGFSAVVFERSRRFGSGQLFHDQDSLNAVLNGRFGLLDPRWNVNHGVVDSRYWGKFAVCRREELEAARRDPGIVHFSYGKPWEYGCPHPWRKLYWDFRKKSPWPEGKPSGFTWRKFFARRRAVLSEFLRGAWR